MIHSFRKKHQKESRQRYMRYDDVFMSRPGASAQNPQRPTRPSYDESYRREFSANDHLDLRRDYSRSSSNENYEYDEYVPNTQDPANKHSDYEENDEYYPDPRNMLDENMVRFQKRQLPPLQRYRPNLKNNVYPDLNRDYWDDEEEERYSKNDRLSALGSMWQKFIITFASILSLICISWIAYNWNGNKSESPEQAGPMIIEPENPTFKVFPDGPGVPSVEHKDKSVYGVIDKGMSRLEPEPENFVPSQSETAKLPDRSNSPSIEEYSIIDDKIYYIKISAGKSKQVLENESMLLKKKHRDLLNGKNCNIKKVSNSKGEQAYAILIGPFQSQNSAIEVAHELGGHCSVISVKE